VLCFFTNSTQILLNTTQTHTHKLINFAGCGFATVGGGGGGMIAGCGNETELPAFDAETILSKNPRLAVCGVEFCDTNILCATVVLLC